MINTEPIRTVLFKIVSLTGNNPEPKKLNHFLRVKELFLEVKYSSNEYFPPPERKMVNPEATPKTPICHSSRQVVPNQPEPSKIPKAKKKTPMLINRVNKPSINKSPTIPSTIVKIAIAHQSWSGLETKCSITGFIPKAFGKK